jgi:MtN3 and saliva related transmembrane protein
MNSQIIGIAAGICTGISLLPQLVKMVRERTSQDISSAMLVCLLIGLMLWITYGAMKQDWPIIVTNAFSLLINCCILLLNYRYRNQGG